MELRRAQAAGKTMLATAPRATAARYNWKTGRRFGHRTSVAGRSLRQIRKDSGKWRPEHGGGLRAVHRHRMIGDNIVRGESCGSRTRWRSSQARHMAWAKR